jgi:hypothetical protein
MSQLDELPSNGELQQATTNLPILKFQAGVFSCPAVQLSLINLQYMSVATEKGENEGASAELFPLSLLRWAGHRSGGVRKPFVLDSGRPTGIRITTPLIRRLQGWVNDLVEGKSGVPETLLLVGGPGNGKTDAVETCIEFLDKALGADGELFEKFAMQYRMATGELPPRKVVVDLASLRIEVPPHLRKSISLVQDATEYDPAGGLQADALLHNELGVRLNEEADGIYLCCVNRGILAHAATIAHEHPDGTGAEQFLTTITRAVTSGPDALKCWPLDGYEHVGVWPMDVESLVDRGSDPETPSVAHQIFDIALDESRWVDACAAGSRCPFCHNRTTLAKSGALDALIDLLRFHELSSGKRWTFRDLFSLVPYLLVGDFSELQIKGKDMGPCEWAAAQLSFAENAPPDSAERAYAPYLLVSRLYQHRLFSLWPGLDKGAHRNAKRILRVGSISSGVNKARALFRYLARRASMGGVAAGDIKDIINGSFSDVLDSSRASGDDPLLDLSNGNTYSVNEIEELFSLSVRDGLDVVRHQISPLERDVLNHLVEADEALIDENFPRNVAHDVRLLQSSIRQFSARLVKRSVGVRRGICRDLQIFQDYKAAVENRSDLMTVRRQLKKLLHDDRNRFEASLVTTFGQPLAQRSREVTLLTQAVAVKEKTGIAGDGRPREYLPYLQVGSSIVPLTFSLFKALKEVISGLHEASLPTEIFTLLNGVKSLVAGQLVRSQSVLDEEAHIRLGGLLEGIEIVEGRFRIIDNAEL